MTTTVRDWYRRRIEHLEAQNAKLVDELLAARRECAPQQSPSTVPASVAAGDVDKVVVPPEVAAALQLRAFTPELARSNGQWAMRQLAAGMEPERVAAELLNGGEG